MSKRKAKQEDNYQLPWRNMDEAKIFDERKKKLQKFSSKVPDIVKLEGVITKGGLFNWFDHDVTGAEFNERLSGIQDIFIEQNDYIKKIISEFNTVYETFLSLDKGYIQGILISLSAAQKANERARDSLRGVSENQAQLKKDQDDIKRIVRNNEQVIEILQSFKKEIESIKHISELDDFFINLQSLEEKVGGLQRNVDNQKSKLTELKETMQNALDTELKKVAFQGKELARINSTINELDQKNAEMARKQNDFYKKVNDLDSSFSKQEITIANRFDDLNDLSGDLSSKYSQLESEISILKEESLELQNNIITISQREEEQSSRITEMKEGLNSQRVDFGTQKVAIDFSLESLKKELFYTKIVACIGTLTSISLIILFLSGVI